MAKESPPSSGRDASPSAAGTPGSKCSIVIPVYGKASLTTQCLDAILADASAVGAEVIVVDDASPDDTAEVLRSYGDRIRVVRHRRNAGFAQSCNDGAAASTRAYVVFLNNDTIPIAGWLLALERYAEVHPEAAVVGAKLLFPDDTIQHAGVVISPDRYPRHIYVGFAADHPAVNLSRPFQIVTAACALVRASVFSELGGFDSDFRNGYEDVDLCLRLGERGFQVHYCHESSVYHLESISRESNTQDDHHNTRLFVERWGHRVRSDELDYYIADGLLALSHTHTYPIHLIVSPELAIVFRGQEAILDSERMLNARSRQVHELLRENVQLAVRARAVEHAAARSSRDEDSPRHGNGFIRADARIAHRGEVRWMSDEPSGTLVSIVMPVKNGAAHLENLLPAIFAQKSDHQVELIAVDSGSDDGTVDLLRENSCTVVLIEPTSFNHGLTRNLGASHARGDILLFVNQTALPANDQWLANLIAPLLLDEQLAGVCSRVLPKPDADPLVYRDGILDPSGSAERFVRKIDSPEKLAALSHHDLRLLINFHTVSAAVRSDVLARIPFRAVTIGEDLAWAKDVLAAGLGIQHEPSSVVLHSHAYSLLELFQRNVDDGMANQQIVGRILNEDEIAPLVEELTRGDWRHLADESKFAGEELSRWQMVASARRAAQVLGQWVGVNRPDVARALSLTETIKAKASPVQRARG